MVKVLPARLGLVLGAAALLCPPAQAQTVDELVKKHVDARGGMDKLKAIQSMRITGKMTTGPGIEIPAVLEFKRPNRFRMEITVQGMTGIQAYDGKTGWSLMPFGGRKDPQPMSPDELKDAEEQADMDGSLVDYQAKGHKVELVGKEKAEGADAYKLKITLKNGDVRYVFLDAEYHLEIRGEARRMIRGSEMETETTYSDFKDVGGVVFPHAIEGGAKGTPQRQRIVAEKIELNVPVDESRFQMPAPAAAPAPTPTPKND
jgi:outer membrane lipoprotein-sorting protein